MLSASYLSLIVPASKISREGGYGPFQSASLVTIAVLIGAASLEWVRRAQPFKGSMPDVLGASPVASRRVWLLVIAMTGHNIPEGAAVGVGFSAGDSAVAIGTAVGIGVQNIPEGLAVAASLAGLGMNRWKAVLIGGLTGAVEPIGALLGASLVSQAAELLPLGMGWAAGAMLYICASELIPAVQDDNGGGKPMAALFFGMGAMLFLDLALS
jgi:ZIP family zinc transporter